MPLIIRLASQPASSFRIFESKLYDWLHLLLGKERILENSAERILEKIEEILKHIIEDTQILPQMADAGVDTI